MQPRGEGGWGAAGRAGRGGAVCSLSHGVWNPRGQGLVDFNSMRAKVDFTSRYFKDMEHMSTNQVRKGRCDANHRPHERANRQWHVMVPGAGSTPRPYWGGGG